MPPRDLATLWVEKRPLVQQASSGPAVTCAADLFGPSSHLEHRDVSRSGRPHCVRWGCATLPDDFTRPLSLGETGQFDWTSRSLHSSSLAGRDRPGRLGARSLHIVLSHWTSQDDWTLKLAGFFFPTPFFWTGSLFGSDFTPPSPQMRRTRDHHAREPDDRATREQRLSCRRECGGVNVPKRACQT